MMFESTGSLSAALSLTLTHTLWLGALLYLALKWLHVMVIPGKHSTGRYYASLAVYGILAISFPLIFFMIYAPGPAGNTGITELLTAVRTGRTGSLQAGIQHGPALHGYVLRGYLAGLLIFSLRWLLGNIRLFRIRSRATSIPASERDRFVALADRAGLSRPPSIRASGAVAVPLVWGFLKPTILVPMGFFAQLPADQLEMLLIHELMHIRQKDHIVVTVQSCIEVILFFNPFSWLISREIGFEREKLIDDRVISACDRREKYARALYSISLIRHGKMTAQRLAADGSGRKKLLFRVNRILNRPNMKTKMKNRFPAVTVAFIAIAGSLILSGSTNPLFRATMNKPVPSSGGTPEAGASVTYVSESLAQQDLIAGEVAGTDTGLVIMHGKEFSDTLSADELEQIQQELEKAHAELESIDWERKFKEMEMQKQEALQRIQEEMAMNQEELSLKQEEMQAAMEHLRSEEFRMQMELTRRQMDSVRRNLDQEAERIRREIELQRKHLREELEMSPEANEALRREIEMQLDVLEDIDVDEIIAEMEEAVGEVEIDFESDFNFDYAFDIDMDSILTEVRISLENVDIEAIKEEVERTKQALEQEIQSIEKQKNQLKNKK